VSEFRNTNIIGDGSEWGGTSASDGSLRFINVGLMGDYSSLNQLRLITKGVIDISGATPTRFSNDGGNGYALLWSPILRETFITGINIIDVKDLRTNGFIRAGNGTEVGAPDVIIYSQRYAIDSAQGTISAADKPAHIAIIDSFSNTPKFTGPGLDFSSAYLGRQSTRDIPKLDEVSWINAANAGLSKPADNFVDGGYSALTEQYKWANQAALEANTITAGD